jgi:hypothetical protein
MAGMMPNRKSSEEIERDFKDLHDKHTQAINSWVSHRLGRETEETPQQDQVCLTALAK